MMKKLILATLLVAALLFTGCADNKTIQGVEYTTYGIANSDDNKNPNIQYELSIGNVIWSALLVQTVVAPVYFLGFSLYEPVGVKDTNKPKGTK